MSNNIKSRSKNSVKNIIYGFGSQMLILLLTFISRTIFINQLGAEYLGVNGLYGNILTVLSLAELGIGNVMIYSLYKPLANRDEKLIRDLLIFYKKLYRNIAIVIFILGIVLVPFLNQIVNTQLSSDKIILYFMLYLSNSVISYFVIYKTTLINADQKIYIIKSYNTLFIIIKEISQIIVLIFTNNYTLYLIVLIVTTFLNNFFLSRKADKMYPFVGEKTSSTIGKEYIKEITQNIKSMFVYRIGAVIMNNTDNILISVLIGTIFVGYYSNYNLIITSVTMFINIIIQSIFSSIGNLNSENKIEKSYDFFKVLILFFHWLAAFCSISFFLVLNDFIILWIGYSYVLDVKFLFAIVLNFYIQHVINPVWIYRETMGLFNQIKYIMLIAATINIIFSVVLGKLIGLEGILISTAIARLLTTVWFEPYLLYHTKFKKSVAEYWRKQSGLFLVTLLIAIILKLSTDSFDVTILNIILKVALCLILISGSFYLFTYKSKEFNMLRNYIIKIISKT